MAPADGAFYIYVDLGAEGVEDSSALCYRILEEAGVAITPGIDFEDPSTGLGRQRVRFSFSRGCRGHEKVFRVVSLLYRLNHLDHDVSYDSTECRWRKNMAKGSRSIDSHPLNDSS
jgi:hypothetical protein